ncbi:uncharacterized protein N7477_003078 [Penicillium maclennaniae]|uniref:uncharacterized protein n=1 Tax=Penicillium maclennaniae TaxID=1343394 RepID=UPI00253FF961|nr:uncharacterized protein N7477_003078 [Penicillium maclennaniae]KAJ5677445.1 hypothetical protein N7477_003078 [Penicillium maclennaniae]
MLRLRHLLRSQSRAFSFHNGSRQTLAAPPTVRHVRFRQPWLRSFFTKFFLYGAAFHLWTSFVLVRFDDDTHDDVSTLESSLEEAGPRRKSRDTDLSAKEGRNKDTEDGAPMFIPLTWSRLREGELYAASDPEWQAFVQLSKDRKKLQKLRDELAALVLESASSRMSQLLGGPLSLTGFWLVHQFPPRAPPEYLRSGLEITDEGVSWVTKPLDPDMGDRLETFMKPLHVALAIKDAYLLLLMRQVNRLRHPQEQPVDALESLNESYTLSRNERLNPLSPHEQPKLQPPLVDGPTESAPSTGDPGLHPSSIIASLQRLPLPDLGPGSDLHLASIAFKLQLNAYRAQMKRTPRRGTFFISGPVGIKGPGGFCRFEVRGEYDPSKSAWRTVEMELKDLNPRKQRALGGH